MCALLNSLTPTCDNLIIWLFVFCCVYELFSTENRKWTTMLSTTVLIATSKSNCLYTDFGCLHGFWFKSFFKLDLPPIKCFWFFQWSRLNYLNICSGDHMVVTTSSWWQQRCGAIQNRAGQSGVGRYDMIWSKIRSWDERMKYWNCEQWMARTI